FTHITGQFPLVRGTRMEQGGTRYGQVPAQRRPPDQAHRRRQRAALSGHWRRVFPADARDRRPARLGRAREARPGGAGSANRLERLVIDIESTQPWFIITGEPRFLGPWDDARKACVQPATTRSR